MNEYREYKITVNVRDNRHGRNFTCVYHVSAPNEGGARSWGRSKFAEQWDGHDVSWLSCKVEELEKSELKLDG